MELTSQPTRPYFLLAIFLACLVGGCSTAKKDIVSGTTSIEVNIPETSCINPHQYPEWKEDIENGILAIDNKGKIESKGGHGIARSLTLKIPVCNSNRQLQIKITSDTKKFPNVIKEAYDKCKQNKSDEKCKQELFIVIHGGLNDYEDSLTHAIDDIPKILCREHIRDKIHCSKTSNSHALFIIWPSGIESYFDALLHYDQGKWDEPDSVWMIPLKFISDIGVSIARAPENYAKSLRRFFYNKSLPKDDLNINNHFSCKDGHLPYPHPPFNGGTCKFADKDEYHLHISENILYTGLTPFRIITDPLLDPLGKRAWESMFSRAHFTIRQPCVSWDTKNTSAIKDSCMAAPVSQLFIELNRTLNGESDLYPYDNYQITLLAHSMGTIVASEIINQFPLLPVKDLVFMGGAVNIREFVGLVEPVLKLRYQLSDLRTNFAYNMFDKPSNPPNSRSDITKGANIFLNMGGAMVRASNIGEEEVSRLFGRNKKIVNNILQMAGRSEIEDTKFINYSKSLLNNAFPPAMHFYNLSLHPYAEANEINDWGMVQSGSLLDWIDEIYESPADLQERTLGKWLNVISSHVVLDTNLQKIGLATYKRFDLSECSPLKHGEFFFTENKAGEREVNCSGHPNYWQPEFWTVKKYDHATIKQAQ